MATLPATTPAAFKAYANANLKGDNGKPGGPVQALSGLGYTGATVGDQWLKFYAAKHGQLGSQYTLLEYEEAFVVLWSDAQLGNNVAQATGATGQIIQADVTGIGKGISQFNTTLGGLPAAAAGAFSSLSFLQGLTSATLWIRVAKVVIGGAMLLIGLAKLTGADKTVAVLGKAAAAAPLL